MTAVLYLFGAVLLAAAGAGGGTSLALRARRRWQDAHAFGRLLDYLHGAIRYRTLTGGEVLQKAAAYPEFARLGLAHCHRLGRLVPPDAFEPALRQELCADLEALESAPRDTACEESDRTGTCLTDNGRGPSAPTDGMTRFSAAARE